MVLAWPGGVPRLAARTQQLFGEFERRRQVQGSGKDPASSIHPSVPMLQGNSCFSRPTLLSGTPISPDSLPLCLGGKDVHQVNRAVVVVPSIMFRMTCNSSPLLNPWSQRLRLGSSPVLGSILMISMQPDEGTIPPWRGVLEGPRYDMNRSGPLGIIRIVPSKSVAFGARVLQ